MMEFWKSMMGGLKDSTPLWIFSRYWVLFVVVWLFVVVDDDVLLLLLHVRRKF